ARCGFADAQGGLGALVPIDLTADTLSIDADRQVCSLVWRGHVEVTHGEQALPWLRVFAGIELPGQPLVMMGPSVTMGRQAAPNPPEPAAPDGEPGTISSQAHVSAEAQPATVLSQLVSAQAQAAVLQASEPVEDDTDVDEVTRSRSFAGV